jgi:hypothetical protein
LLTRACRNIYSRGDSDGDWPFGLAIDGYFGSVNEPPASRQALSKARKNIRPEFIREYANESAEIAAPLSKI